MKVPSRCINVNNQYTMNVNKTAENVSNYFGTILGTIDRK